MTDWRQKRWRKMEREIEEFKQEFVKNLAPLKIYLFGSFANGTNNENSDFDLYI